MPIATESMGGRILRICMAIGMYSVPMLVSAPIHAEEFTVDLRTPPVDTVDAQANKSTSARFIRLRGGIEEYQIEVPSYATNGSAQTKPKPMPITIEVLRIWPLSLTNNADIDVDLRLKNIGKEPITVPVATGLHEVLSTPGRQRKALRLQFKAELPDGFFTAAREIRGVLPAMFGSSAIPNSLLILQPNDQLLIRTTGELRTAAEIWLGQEKRQVITANLKVSGYIETLSDDELKIVETSAEVLSNNSVQVTLSQGGR